MIYNESIKKAMEHFAKSYEALADGIKSINNEKAIEYRAKANELRQKIAGNL